MVSVTGGACCNRLITFLKETDTVDAGFVKIKLVCLEVIFPHHCYIRVASAADFWNILWFWYPYKSGLLIHCIIRVIRVSTVAIITINPCLFVDTLLPVCYSILKCVLKVLM